MKPKKNYEPIKQMKSSNQYGSFKKRYQEENRKAISKAFTETTKELFGPNTFHITTIIK